MWGSLRPALKILPTVVAVILENATHCGASLSEQLKPVVSFLQLLKTVLFDFAKNAGILALSGFGNRRED